MLIHHLVYITHIDSKEGTVTVRSNRMYSDENKIPIKDFKEVPIVGDLISLTFNTEPSNIEIIHG